MNSQHEPRGLRQLLDSAVADEPPLTLDAGRVVAAGERRLVRHKLAYAGTAVAVAAVLGAGALALPGRGNGDANRSTLHPATQTSPTPTPTATPTAPSQTPAPPDTSGWPTTNVPEFRDAGDPAQVAIAARLTTALRKSFPKGITATPAGSPDLPALTFRVSQGGFKAFADLRDGGGKGNIFIYVMDLPSVELVEEACGAAPPTQSPGQTRGIGSGRCVAGPGRSVLELSGEGKAGEAQSWSLTAYRRDGVQVMVTVTNYTEKDNPPAKNSSPKPQRATRPLTEQAMIALATNPALKP
jgi:hypothetical protein